MLQLLAILIFLGTSIYSWASSPYLKQCGEYLVQGKLDCEKKSNCDLIINHKSIAETRIQIRGRKYLYKKYKSWPIQMKIHIDSIQTNLISGNPLSLPKRRFPEINPLKAKHAIQKIRGKKCKN